MRLADELWFSGTNGGGLRSARYAEGLGLRWASLAYDAGYGERVTYRVFVAKKGRRWEALGHEQITIRSVFR